MTLKEQVHQLLAAQDMVRRVWVNQDTASVYVSRLLRAIDKDMTVAINILGEPLYTDK